MRSCKFLYIGLAFFVLALGSLALSRSPKVARRIVTSKLQAEALAPRALEGAQGEAQKGPGSAWTALGL